MNKIIKLLFLALLLVSCEDLFTPATENIRDISAMYAEPTYAQGILANGYILLPYTLGSNSDVSTDDAVTNDKDNNYMKMATGSWAADNDPMSQWQGRKNAIQYLNIFLANADEVLWSNDEVVRTLYNDRLKGEAYGLRAVHMYYLLQAHGGWSEDGQLLGVPVVTEPETSESNFNLPRNTFQECIEQIYKDCETAIELLPLDYGDISDAEIPVKYQALGVTNSSTYNRVNGDIMRGRITGRIVEAVRSQVALLGASPAYSDGTGVTWEDAAKYAGMVLDRIGGVAGLASNGLTWYANANEIQNLGSGEVPAEIIWRSNKSNSADADGLSLEKDNFPPSLYGSGRINPTQNLVDAFPMANGFPINDEQSGYDQKNPYEGRDPRLGNYIVYNGSKQGPNDTEIITGTYSSTIDGINKESTSTRTGYYLRKLLRSDCNPNPQYNTAQYHYAARIRYTEIFLNYAEAANEAYGPTGKGEYDFSAYDVIKAIRQRAGIGENGNDPYLESVKNDKDKMRTLIRNERRLELCFENKRFWDLRRWKENLNQTAQGIQIDKLADGTLKYTPVDVEPRTYKEYMYYGPVPYSEVQKWDQLLQNKGW